MQGVWFHLLQHQKVTPKTCLKNKISAHVVCLIIMSFVFVRCLRASSIVDKATFVPSGGPRRNGCLTKGPVISCNALRRTVSTVVHECGNVSTTKEHERLSMTSRFAQAQGGNAKSLHETCSHEDAILKRRVE